MIDYRILNPDNKRDRKEIERIEAMWQELCATSRSKVHSRTTASYCHKCPLKHSRPEQQYVYIPHNDV